jgi:hypothetical protein
MHFVQHLLESVLQLRSGSRHCSRLHATELFFAQRRTLGRRYRFGTAWLFPLGCLVQSSFRRTPRMMKFSYRMHRTLNTISRVHTIVVHNDHFAQSGSGKQEKTRIALCSPAHRCSERPLNRESSSPGKGPHTGSPKPLPMADGLLLNAFWRDAHLAL